MKHITYRKLISSIFVFTFVLFTFACNNSNTDTTSTDAAAGEVIEAYKNLYTAVKEKDAEKVKNMMSEKTLVFAEGVAAQRNKPIGEILENGLYASTINPEMPEIRDERIKDGKYGAVEVFVKKTNNYEQVYFVKENDGWKVAVGDLFAGSFQHPDKSKAQIEADASNTMVPYNPNSNSDKPMEKPSKNNAATMNANVKTIEIEPANMMPQTEKKAEQKK